LQNGAFFASSYQLSPEHEFWAHSSNLQAFEENNYDTSLLHSNIAFPLLRRLSEAGDMKSKKKFKEEIAKRFSTGYLPILEFLHEEGFLELLNEEEKEAAYQNLTKNIENKEDIEQALSTLIFLDKLHFSKARRDIKNLLQRELKKDNPIISKVLFSYEFNSFLSNDEIIEILDSNEVLTNLSQYSFCGFNLLEDFDSNDIGFNIQGNKVIGLSLNGCIHYGFPEEILKLLFLQDLSLSYNKFKSLPKSLHSLNNLKSLHLECNQLEFLPNSIGELKNLIKLELTNNNLKCLPDSIGNLKSLKSLQVGSNKLSDLPPTFIMLEKLEELYLDDNNFSTFPEIIIGLKSLKKLIFSSTKIEMLEELFSA
ncbi:hypothetical protein LCGC14_2996640, partial [marine sediment metagenome]